MNQFDTVFSSKVDIFFSSKDTLATAIANDVKKTLDSLGLKGDPSQYIPNIEKQIGRFLRSKLTWPLADLHLSLTPHGQDWTASPDSSAWFEWAIAGAIPFLPTKMGMGVSNKAACCVVRYASASSGFPTMGGPYDVDLSMGPPPISAKFFVKKSAGISDPSIQLRELRKSNFRASDRLDRLSIAFNIMSEAAGTVFPEIPKTVLLPDCSSILNISKNGHLIILSKSLELYDDYLSDYPRKELFLLSPVGVLSPGFSPKSILEEDFSLDRLRRVIGLLGCHDLSSDTWSEENKAALVRWKLLAFSTPER